MIISHFIRRARLIKGLTRLQLDGAIGARKGTVGSWEQGRARPQAKWLAPLSDVLGVTIETMVDSYLEQENPEFTQ